MTAPRSRPSVVIAGVLAVCASLTALGAFVYADVAQASTLPAEPEWSDEPTAPTEVTATKVRFTDPPRRGWTIGTLDGKILEMGKFDGY